MLDRHAQALTPELLSAAGTEENSHVAELLLGMRPMPSGRIPAVLAEDSEELQAALYVHSCADLWESCPGALDFLRRAYNTVRATTHLVDVKTGEVPAPDFALLEECLADCDINALVQGSLLLNLVLELGPLPEVPGLVRCILAKGARVQEPDQRRTRPIYHAASNFADPGMPCPYLAGPKAASQPFCKPKMELYLSNCMQT